METVFAVIFETGYKTKILFEGTKRECQIYMKLNPEMCSTYTFIQELESV